jgi:DNA topoisomerase II
VSKFEKENAIISNQVRFIQEIIDGRFKMIQSKQQWIVKLREGKYARFQDLNKVESTKNKEEDENDKNSDYNYLLNMPIWSFCQEKINDMTSVQKELSTIVDYYQTVTEK